MSFVKSDYYKKHKDHIVMIVNQTRSNATTYTCHRFVCVTCGRTIGKAPFNTALYFKSLNKPAGVVLSDLFNKPEKKHEN